jgi:F420-non-reducing hydrogenase iron-sulfur subunit
MGNDYKPVIVCFCCNWCSYAAADAAGTARIQYPSSVHIIRAMCSGMVHPNIVTEALTQGADGVLVCGCHIGDCHYQDGNKRAESRAEAIKLLLEDFGLEQERFRLEWVSASEGPKFARVIQEMTEQLAALGPSPYRQGAASA